VKRGWGVNSSEDARYCSVLYIWKYFVVQSIVSPTDAVSSFFLSVA
jgi:hypothetical protein